MKMSTIVVAALVMVPTLLSMDSLRAEEMKGMNMSAQPAATPVDKALAGSMQDMMKAMNVKPTGNPHKDFVLMMTPHHQGVDMAKV